MPAALLLALFPAFADGRRAPTASRRLGGRERTSNGRRPCCRTPSSRRGATAADFDQDGAVDLLIGPTLYFGPDWTRRREVKPAKAVSPLGYSEEFLTFAADLTGDGYPDAITVGFPGKAVLWFENPGSTLAEGRDYRTDGHWKQHLLASEVDNESPLFADLVGDEMPELIAQTGGAYGYWTAPADPRGRWVFHPVSEPQEGLGRFTHGLGAGDLDGDGRDRPADERRLVPAAGVVGRRPAVGVSPRPVLPAGGPDSGVGGRRTATGDADDVVTARQGPRLRPRLVGADGGRRGREVGPARGHGRRRVQRRDGRGRGNRCCSGQPHGLAAADVNGDGLTDIVTGKRFWAHGPDGDADPGGEPVLYWFELTRDGGEVRFVPHLIDDASGIGTQVFVGDVTGDGRPDVVVGNKRGAFVSVQK